MAKRIPRPEEEFPAPRPKEPYPIPPEDVEPDTKKPSKAYAKGGSVYRRVADGIAKRGKTKGRLL